MLRAFSTAPYEDRLRKLSSTEQERIHKLEQQLKEQPYAGKPLGTEFLREKKLHDKRLLFLIYPTRNVILFVTITDKKMQQDDIAFIKRHLREYALLIERKLRD